MQTKQEYHFDSLTVHEGTSSDPTGASGHARQFTLAFSMMQASDECLISQKLYGRTSSQLSDEQLTVDGISSATVRLAIGIENSDDLMRDLNHALTPL